MGERSEHRSVLGIDDESKIIKKEVKKEEMIEVKENGVLSFSKNA